MGEALDYRAAQVLVHISCLAGRERTVLEREAGVFFGERNALGEIPFKPRRKEAAGAGAPALPTAPAPGAGSSLPFPPTKQCHLPTRVAAVFLCQEKDGKKISELRHSEYLHCVERTFSADVGKTLTYQLLNLSKILMLHRDVLLCYFQVLSVYSQFVSLGTEQK